MLIFVHKTAIFASHIPGRLVNTIHIQRVDPKNEGSLITFSNGAILRVSETVHAIHRLSKGLPAHEPNE